MSETNPAVVHLGGAFIYSKNPARLAEWYRQHLGIEYLHTPEHKVWFVSFFYNDEATGRRAYCVWSILENQNRPEFEGKVFCINYRVNHLEALVEKLREKNIEVKGVDAQPEGKFAWLHDIDGNYVELWEDTTLAE